MHHSDMNNDKNVFQKFPYLYPIAYFIFLLLSYLVNNQVYYFGTYLLIDVMVIIIGLGWYVIDEIKSKNESIKCVLCKQPNISHIFTYIPIVIIISLMFMYGLHQFLKFKYSITYFGSIPIWTWVQTLRMFNNISPLLLLLLLGYRICNKRTKDVLILLGIMILITSVYMPSTLAMHPPHLISLIFSKIKSI